MVVGRRRWFGAVLLAAAGVGLAAGKARPRAAAEQRRRLADAAGSLRGRRASNSTTRTTWNGCECRSQWAFPGVGSCNTSCCNPDSDGRGAWCMVVNSSCEQSDWGYCRPENATTGRCADSPPAWADSEGDTCGDYGGNFYCTPDSDYGSGWQQEWGNIEDFASGGIDAFAACCACGGGSAVDHRCRDDAGWTDSDGDGCGVYADSAWCNATGHAGVGWHEEWGTFRNFSKENKTAADACCACGGGDRSTAPMVPGTVQRFTWNSCACQKAWGTCTTYCCPTAEDSTPRCKVQDPACEEAEFGFCRPVDWSPAREDACSNEPSGWVDKMGYNCPDYEELSLCTPDGETGSGWQTMWGSIESAKPPGGQPATSVCCACGGGKREGVKPSHYMGCYDDPEWKDKDGDDCEAYADSQWCTPDGKPGPGWHQAWGSFESHSNDKTALQACCACGGGRRSSIVDVTVRAAAKEAAPTTTPAPTPAPPATTPAPAAVAAAIVRYTWNGCQCKQLWTDQHGHSKCETSCCNPDGDTFGSWCKVQDRSCEGADWGYCRAPEDQEEFATCKNSPIGWKDMEADDCAKYDSEGWCTKNGTAGPNWKEAWGKIEEYKSLGKSALQACCQCGGGVPKGNRSNGCVDVANWKDPDGDACSEYQDYDWCTPTGGYGVGWHKEWGVFRGSPTAAKACCFCGGGSLAKQEQVIAAAASGEQKDGLASAVGGAATGGAVFMILLVVVIAGVGAGWYCYRAKASTKDAEGLGAGVGNKKGSRKYATMDESAEL